MTIYVAVETNQLPTLSKQIVFFFLFISAEVEEVTEALCALTDWGDWSECTPKCGSGTQTKRRKYVNKRAKKRCEGGDNHPLLIITRDCHNPPCIGEITPSDEDEQVINTRINM